MIAEIGERRAAGLPDLPPVSQEPKPCPGCGVVQDCRGDRNLCSICLNTVLVGRKLVQEHYAKRREDLPHAG